MDSDRNPTASEIRDVAKKAVAVLESAGFSCCLFGSAGCYLYGASRLPNDVDIVVMTSLHDTEYLKGLLAKRNPSAFYLRPGKTPGATYKVLFARLRSIPSIALRSPRRSCKVDILTPGILNIPYIDPSRLLRLRFGTSADILPVMPILPLLLLKLQGWSDHRASPRTDMQAKQHVDIRDIEQLLRLAVARGEDLRRETWLPTSFVSAARERVTKYLTIVRPAAAQSWKNIGLGTDDGNNLFARLGMLRISP